MSEPLASFLSPDIRKQVKRCACQMVFRFGNQGTLQSNHALVLPIGQVWLKVAIVPGGTPFLLSNTLMRVLRAQIDCFRKQLISSLLKEAVPLTLTTYCLPSVSLRLHSCLPSCWSLRPSCLLCVCFCLPSCWSLRPPCLPSCLPLSAVSSPFLLVTVSVLSPFCFLLSSSLFCSRWSLCPSCLPSVSFCLPSCWSLCPPCLPSCLPCLKDGLGNDSLLSHLFGVCGGVILCVCVYVCACLFAF